jgi:NAD-dependent deacetylase sirtuin 4
VEFRITEGNSFDRLVLSEDALHSRFDGLMGYMWFHLMIWCSPNGAYSSGFKPITHQEFTRSSRARRRYWARSYAGWRRFTAAQPGPAHTALASLEKAGRINFMITQNVDRLHHRAGSDPLELHGTVYTVMCLECGFSFPRDLFQDQLKAINPKASVYHNLNKLD